MQLFKSFLAAISLMVGVTVLIVSLMIYPEVFLWVLLTFAVVALTVVLTLWFETYIF